MVEQPGTFNSLSRDHLLVHGDPYVRTAVPFNSLSRDHLLFQMLYQRSIQSGSAFNSLSRDHLLKIPALICHSVMSFQLPLSGSLRRAGGRGLRGRPIAFNSLSRDHL